ncbi:MAG: hypothetical protein ACRERU_05080, partial [Methylococcales bacterium]
MKALPDLDRLSVSEKDDLIPVLFGQVHVLATSALTWIGSHTKRGKKAFDAFGILAVFAGTPVARWLKAVSRSAACTCL